MDREHVKGAANKVKGAVKTPRRQGHRRQEVLDRRQGR